MDYIAQIKMQGFTNFVLVDSFSDGEYTQIEFKDSINTTHIAFFKEKRLITII